MMENNTVKKLVAEASDRLETLLDGDFDLRLSSYLSAKMTTQELASLSREDVEELKVAISHELEAIVSSNVRTAVDILFENI